MSKKVCVIGLGYIGLPAACIIAEQGLSVFGVDINKKVLENIKKYNVDFNEPCLENILKKSILNGNLKLFDKPVSSDFFLICTPTPVKFKKKIGKPDLNFVYSAIDSLIMHLKNNNSIIIESTIPVGTTNEIRDYILLKRPDLDKIYIAHCPERVLPGNIIFELRNNPRIIGGVNKISTDKISDFYKKFVSGKIIKTSCSIAELCKLAENSYRDINIAFANELSLICNDKNINVSEVINLANFHPRVNILQPGIGVGGHCIPVDPWFLINDNVSTTKLMQVAREVNVKKTKFVISDIENKISLFFKNNNKLPFISFLGVSYKPNSSDIRDAPAIKIINKIQKKFTNFCVVDPYVKKVLGIDTKDINFAIKHSDIMFILVKHSNFKEVKNLDINNFTLIDYSQS